MLFAIEAHNSNALIKMLQLAKGTNFQINWCIICILFVDIAQNYVCYKH